MHASTAPDAVLVITDSGVRVSEHDRIGEVIPFPGTDPADSYAAFVDRRLGELGRLAYLLTGDHASADDLASDTLLATWRQWDQIRGLDHPVAYVRRIMVNLAASRIRTATRERRRIRLFHADVPHSVRDHDGAAVIDVRAALRALPARRRACVVLRHALDLSEAEVARTLGISVGTVKSQTAKGMAQLQSLLGDQYGVGDPWNDRPRSAR